MIVALTIYLLKELRERVCLICRQLYIQRDFLLLTKFTLLTTLLTYSSIDIIQTSFKMSLITLPVERYLYVQTESSR